MENMEGGFPPKKTEEVAPAQAYVVGAKQNPDGTMDYSSAVHMMPTEAQVKGAKEQKERETEAEAKKFEIPEDVKPGTATMLFYKLRNEKDFWEKAKNESSAQNLANIDVLNSMLTDANLQSKIEEKVKQEMTAGGAEVSAETIRQKLHELPAKEMVEYVQEFFVDRYKKLQDEKQDMVPLQQGHFSKEYATAYLLAIAQNLQNRLLEESRDPVAPKS